MVLENIGFTTLQKEREHGGVLPIYQSGNIKFIGDKHVVGIKISVS